MTGIEKKTSAVLLPNLSFLESRTFLLLLEMQGVGTKCSQYNTAIHCLQRDGKKGHILFRQSPKALKNNPNTSVIVCRGFAKLEGEKVAVYLIPSSLLLDLSLMRPGLHLSGHVCSLAPSVLAHCSVCVCARSHSVVSGSLQPHRLQPTRLLCP